MTIRRSYVDGPYGQIHYADGSNGVPLVLLHQSPTSMLQFDRALEPLAAIGIRPIAMDTPGFGMSDTPDFVPSIDDYAKAVIALIDALDLSECHILGHHTGAQTATEVAIHDKRVKGLILNTPFFLTPEENDEMRGQIVPFEQEIKPRADGGHMLDLWNWRAQFAEGFSPEVMHIHVVEQLRRLSHGWYGHNACFDYDHAARIKEVKQPTLVLTNTGDFLLPYAERIKSIRPDFKYVEMEGGTVDIVDDQPDTWAEIVSGFVLESKGSGE